MKQRIYRLFGACLSAALAMLLLGGCALPSPVPTDDSATAQTETYEDAPSAAAVLSGAHLIDVTDMAGNPVQMDAFASRIVVFDPGDCELLCAMGAQAQIVGRGDLCNYPAELVLIPVVASGSFVGTDLLLSLTPQAVILNAEYAADADLITALQNAGVQVVVTNVTNVNSLYTDITLLGAVSDHAKEASALIASFVSGLASVQSKATGDRSQTIYFELGKVEGGYQTAGAGTIFNDIALMLGFRNEFEDMDGFLTVTADQIIGRSPDVIVTITPPGDDGTGGVTDILSREGWESVHALVSKRVYYVEGDLVTRSGPRLLDGMNALYTAIYETPAP